MVVIRRVDKISYQILMRFIEKSLLPILRFLHPNKRGLGVIKVFSRIGTRRGRYRLERIDIRVLNARGAPATQVDIIRLVQVLFAVVIIRLRILARGPRPGSVGALAFERLTGLLAVGVVDAVPGLLTRLRTALRYLRVVNVTSPRLLAGRARAERALDLLVEAAVRADAQLLAREHARVVHEERVERQVVLAAVLAADRVEVPVGVVALGEVRERAVVVRGQVVAGVERAGARAAGGGGHAHARVAAVLGLVVGALDDLVAVVRDIVLRAGAGEGRRLEARLAAGAGEAGGVGAADGLALRVERAGAAEREGERARVVVARDGRVDAARRRGVEARERAAGGGRAALGAPGVVEAEVAQVAAGGGAAPHGPRGRVRPVLDDERRAGARRARGRAGGVHVDLRELVLEALGGLAEGGVLGEDEVGVGARGGGGGAGARGRRAGGGGSARLTCGGGAARRTRRRSGRAPAARSARCTRPAPCILRRTLKPTALVRPSVYIIACWYR